MLKFVRAFALSGIIVTLVLAGWGVFIEPRLLLVQETSFKIEGLERPLRVLLVSDTHLEGERLEPTLSRLRTVIDQLGPLDAIIYGGDLLERFEDAPLVAKRLGEIGDTGLRIFVPGNHEEDGFISRGFSFQPRLAFRGGFYVRNDRSVIEKAFVNEGFTVLRDQALSFAGVRWVGLAYQPTNGQTAAGRALLAQVQPTIAIAHSPDQLWNLPAHVALGLGGHTHGGQVRLPFLAPLTATQTVLPTPSGRMLLNGTPVLITRGVGHSISVRFGAPPEVVLLHLEP